MTAEEGPGDSPEEAEEEREAAFQSWRALRAAGGARVTVLRLYDILAEMRGVDPHDLPVDERRDLATRAFTAIWPGFELLPFLGRHGEPVEVHTYDPGWPRKYESWRSQLAAALGPIALRIDHVGSTSVPSLDAKPVVDIQLSVADLEDESPYVPACTELGLVLRSRDEQHRFFRPAPDLTRDVQLHVCQAGTEWERVHLLFRDFLRTHHEAREAYAAAKHHAADTWRDDRAAYTEAKTLVVLDILESAESWAATIGWSLDSIS